MSLSIHWMQRSHGSLFGLQLVNKLSTNENERLKESYYTRKTTKTRSQTNHWMIKTEIAARILETLDWLLHKMQRISACIN